MDLSAPARRLLSRAGAHMLLLAGAVAMLLPFYWMLSTSLMTYDQSITFPPSWFPDPVRWENYLQVWRSPYTPIYYFNSILVSVVTTGVEVVLCILAAYAFARLRFLGKGLVFTVLLSTLMVPGEMLLVPNYITLARLQWVNTYYALIVPWITSVFGVFLLRQHFLTVPDELFEAARIDGCGHARYLWQVMVPLSRPAIATVALFKFIGSWNAFLWPLIATNTPEMRTVPIGLMAFMQDEGPKYNLWMAAATTALVPVLLLFLAAQKQFIEGVARTGLKG